MVAAASMSFEPQEAERRFLLTGVPWSAYVALRDALEGASVRMTFLEGSLELMSPSELHEEDASLIARLLEAWADEVDLDLRSFGSATFRREAGLRGAEPDKCYTLGPKAKDAPPQLAIEVLVSNPLVDKLEVYAGLGVAEVWLWRSSTRSLAVHRLAGEGYRVVERSALLPALDLTLLASFVRPGESHTALVKAFRAAVRAQRATP